VANWLRVSVVPIKIEGGLGHSTFDPLRTSVRDNDLRFIVVVGIRAKQGTPLSKEGVAITGSVKAERENGETLLGVFDPSKGLDGGSCGESYNKVYKPDRKNPGWSFP